MSDWSSDVRHLGHLSRGEEELDVGGWRLQRFQERVERVLGQHVDFVDNVDLVPRRDGGMAYGLDNFAHIVHARMGGGVHLYDVDMPPFGYGLAGLAHAAGVDGGRSESVRANADQRLGNKARSGGLAYAAHASHQEGMGQASALSGVAQGPDRKRVGWG